MTEISLIKFDGKPLEKLVEVISSGIGTLYRPRSIRKDAEAEAYKIELIERAKSRAIAENKELDAETADKIQDRIFQKEIRRQRNIDTVSHIAANQLKIEETVSSEPVDVDWATRLFNIVEDVSNEEMQTLWGRILAGEVKQPKSFSVRTLELLKNLSKDEAETFTKFAQIALFQGEKYFVFDPDNGKFLQENFDIKFTDRLKLVDVGLIVAERNLEFSFNAVLESETTNGLFYGKKGFSILRKVNTPKQGIQVMIFSKPGIELLKMVQPIYDDKYIERIAQAFKHELTTVSFGDMVPVGNELYQIKNEKVM